LLEVLDPNVVLRADVGLGRPPQAPLVGAENVARRALTFGPTTGRFGRLAQVNGATGLVIAPGDSVLAVVAVTTSHDRIVEFDVIADPEKLRRLELRL
jgi:RNA polymerase sigma-70 factor (ECF subfamily)